MAAGPVRLQQAVYISWEVQQCLVDLLTRCTTRNDPHANLLLAVEHSAVNEIFVHPLYGAVQLHGGAIRTCPTGCVHIVGSPAEPCTLGVRLGTTVMAMQHWAVNTLPPTELWHTRCAEL